MAIPTKLQFETYGMDSLDSIPASAWAQLTGPVTVHLYSEGAKVNPRIELAKANLAYILKQTDSLVAKGDVKKLEVDITGPGKVLLSFDQGVSYQTYGTSWETVDTTDMATVRAKAMSATTLAAIPQEAFTGKRDIRFAFFIDLVSETDVVSISDVKLTTIPDATSTPSVGAIGIEVKELSIEGRLKELERMNAMQLAKLNFKAGAILGADQLMLHDMQVDLFTLNTAEIVSLIEGKILEIDLMDGEAEVLESGFLYRAQISRNGAKIKIIETIAPTVSTFSEIRYLVSKDNIILHYKIDSMSGETEWVSLPETVLTKDLFLTHGMTDMSAIPEEAWAELGTDFEILCFKEEAAPLQVKVTTETLYDEANQRYQGTGKAKVEEATLPPGVKQVLVQAMYENTVFTLVHEGVDLGVIETGIPFKVPGAGKIELFAELTAGTLDAVSLAWM